MSDRSPLRLSRASWIRAALPVVGMGVGLWAVVGTTVGFPCFSTGVRYGMWVDTCPTTELRLHVDAQAMGLLRGQPGGTLHLSPNARFLRGEGAAVWVDQEVLRRGVDAVWSLERDGEPVEGLRLEAPSWDGRSLVTPAILPDVPDGDYTLVADVVAPFEQRRVEVPLPLYAPAVVHVAADRPLYKPGQTIHMRSVVLRRTDLVPLDERPGTWTVTDPRGEVLMQERSAAGSWAVAATSFPLSEDATHGTWTIAYQSGSDTDAVQVDVRPFTLPRLTVEAAPSERWYGIDDEVVIEGSVRWASGAPAANAAIAVTLRPSEGRWPMPLAWEETSTTQTDAAGRYRLVVGRVPSDLIERAKVSASVTAVTDTGEVTTGGTTLILSVDDLAVAAVTELAGGLVQGFPNRMYVRVTEPDGRPMANQTFTLVRPYDPDSPKTVAETDEDGVAAVPIDPGPPVTVILPAPPARPRPLVPDLPTLNSAARDLNVGLDLAERRAFDGVLGRVADCGSWVRGAAVVRQGVRVDGAGRVTEVLPTTSGLDRCVADAVRAASLPPGATRTYTLTWQVPDSQQPSLQWSSATAHGIEGDAAAVIEQAGLAARRCLPRGAGWSGAEVVNVHWTQRAGEAALRADVTAGRQSGLAPATLACVTQSFRDLRLPAPATDDAMGTRQAVLNVPVPPGTAVPQPVALTGYELAVTGASGASTRLVLSAGAIPPLRLRATPSVVKPGESVTVELFRGPDFFGELPKELTLQRGSTVLARAAVVDKAATFTVPDDAEGFADVQWADARVVIYVEPAAPLQVALATDRPVYRPGDEATLQVRTFAGGAPAAASVSLAGVDLSLSQLASLLPADDFGRVTVRASSTYETFDAFDARAVALGQVRGANARQATLLAVGALPMDAAGDVGATGSGYAAPPESDELAQAFFAILAEAGDRVAAWEQQATDGQTMTPATMAALWDDARAAVAAAGSPTTDAFGRPLTLQNLPDELLVQVDPRVMVRDGARLPEDVVSWVGWVRTGGAP